MPHLTENDRAALLDPAGGDASEAKLKLRAHIAECEECRAIAAADAAAEREVGALLERLDHPLPALDFATIQAMANVATSSRAAEVLTTSIRGAEHHVVRRMSRHRISRWGWRGIGIMTFGVATVAAALVPDSPVRRIVAQFVARLTSSSAPAPSSHPVAPPTPTLDAAQRGVSIVPSGAATITFARAGSAGTIHVVYGARPHVTVRASAAGATYMVGPDGITVDNTAAGTLDYTIELPALAESAPIRIVVGDALIYSAANGAVMVPTKHRVEVGYDFPMRLLGRRR